MAKDYVIEKEKPDFEVRTDLALEERESFPGDGGEISGVSLREWQDRENQVKLTEVKILDERGAAAMGKPLGTYLTLEADQLAGKDEDYHEEVSKELARHIQKLVKSMMERVTTVVRTGTERTKEGIQEERKAEERENLVFILWGAYAQKKGAFIDRNQHLVLASAHPSPLSAYNGFFGNKHFSRANEYLTAHGQQPIQW